MKLSMKPVAIAVALGLCSAAAHAQLAAPVYAPNPCGVNGGTGCGSADLTMLYVSVFDTSIQTYELASLNYNYAMLIPGGDGGPLSPDTAGPAFQTAVNPSTGSGSVLQLNWGVLPNFATLFPTVSSTTEFMVAAQTSANAVVLTSGNNITSQGILTTVAQNVSGLLSAWQISTQNGNSTATSTSAADPFNANGAAGNSGDYGATGTTFASQLGTAADFYNITKNGRTAVNTTEYANATGAGFWFVSNTGDVTWNVPIASPVPLPAAVWLLISGLAGLGAIQRRRMSAAAA